MFILRMIGSCGHYSWAMMRWVLFRDFVSTASLFGAIMLSVNLVYLFWDIPAPAFLPPEWDSMPYHVIAWLIAIVVYLITNVGALLWLVAGDEWGTLERSINTLVPSHIVAIILYKVVSGGESFPWKLGLAIASAIIVVVPFVMNIVMSIQRAERTLEAGPTPPS